MIHSDGEHQSMLSKPKAVSAQKCPPTELFRVRGSIHPALSHETAFVVTNIPFKEGLKLCPFPHRRVHTVRSPQGLFLAPWVGYSCWDKDSRRQPAEETEAMASLDRD